MTKEVHPLEQLTQYVQGSVIAHTGVCRKLHKLLPDAGNIQIKVAPGSRVSADSLRRFLAGVGSCAPQKRWGRARWAARRGGGKIEGEGKVEGEGRVELVVRDAAALNALVRALRASLGRDVTLDLGHLVQFTSTTETLHRMCELIETCGTRLVALDLCSNELLPRHIGQVRRRNSTPRNTHRRLASSKLLDKYSLVIKNSLR